MDIAIILDNISDALIFFWNSGFFFFVKTLIAVYVVVLFIDIILLLIIRGVSGDVEKSIRGTTMPLASKKKMRNRWERIEKRLQADNFSQYKIAILEADSFVNEVLIKIGYKGSNMGERLEAINKKQFERIDDLVNSHQVRNKIIYDKNFLINKKEAREIIRPYKDILEEFDII